MNRSSNPVNPVEQSSQAITNREKDEYFYSDPKVSEGRGPRGSNRSNSINLKVECIDGELRDQIIINNLKHSEAVATQNQSS